MSYQYRPRPLIGFRENACWCIGISVEGAGKLGAIIDIVFAATQFICYLVLYFCLSTTLEYHKKTDHKVCDTSLKTIDEPDDCEEKASKVALGLLFVSFVEFILSGLIIWGTFKRNVDICYTWFIFSGLVTFVLPFLQYIFFAVTTWWNESSGSILAISIAHSGIKLYEMTVIIQYVYWIRHRYTSDSDVSRGRDSRKKSIDKVNYMMNDQEDSDEGDVRKTKQNGRYNTDINVDSFKRSM